MAMWQAGPTGTPYVVNEIVGLDLHQALRSLPCGYDREFSRGLFIAAEAAFLTAIRKHNSKDDNTDG
jgi:hypothetical protein